MTERQKQTEFLKKLICSGDTEPCRDLQARLAQAQRDEYCVRRMIRWMAVLALISLTGLGYIAVFLPEEFQKSLPLLLKYFPMPLVLKFFFVLGGGALICLVAFGGCWCWYRALVNHLLDEGRHLVQSMVESRLHPGHSTTIISLHQTQTGSPPANGAAQENPSSTSQKPDLLKAA